MHGLFLCQVVACEKEAAVDGKEWHTLNQNAQVPRVVGRERRKGQ
jgi:hypothetical protein